MNQAFDSSANPPRESDELKRDLNEDLSQLVRQYDSKGLAPSEIVDSILWHAEVAASRSSDGVTSGRTVDEYCSTD